MNRKEIADTLLAAAVGLDAQGDRIGKRLAEICMQAAEWTLTVSEHRLGVESKEQRTLARWLFQIHPLSHMPWTVLEARVRAFCAYMLNLAMEVS